MALYRFEFLSGVLGEMTNVSLAVPMRETGREMVREGRKFKVIYLLHGGSGDSISFLKDTGIERYSEQGNFAVVMPEVRNSYYCDMVKGLPFFTYLSEELPQVIEKLFPISEKREDHFLMGNSMGAQGTIKWALRRPDFFEAAAGMSGMGSLDDLGFFDRFEDDSYRTNPFRASFGSIEEYYESENDIKFLARRLVKSGERIPRLFSCCGTEDFTYEGCAAFVKYAEKIGLPIQFEEGPGEHTYDFWDRWMKYIISWFGLGEVL
ncbi:MAG: esterase family protein [Lachnospiraceae bacterium]|nr:esterase family protein [Lachnospiraceae bacterium]